MAVRATLRMKVRDGRAEDFERAWLAVAERVRSLPGNLRQSLLRDPDDASTFVVVTDWDSRATFSQFEHSPEQDDLTAPLRDLRESANMTVYEVLHDIKGGSPT